MTKTLSRRAAVAGVGLRQYKRGASPYSQRHVLLRAIVDAAEDAGLHPSEIDGFISYGDDVNEPIKLMYDLGVKETRWSGTIWGGGGGGTCGAVGQAAAAIAAGQAEAIVVYRALVQQNSGRLSEAVAANHFNLHYLMSGLVTPAQLCALHARYLMEVKGVPRSALDALVRVDYHHASTNPEAATYGNRFTIEDLRASRYISEPYRLFDCSRENDGAGALLVVSAERARDLKKPPAYIVATGQGAKHGGGERHWNDPNFASAGFETIAPRVYADAGMTAADIDVVQVYENFIGQAVAALIDHGFATYESAEEELTFENMIAQGGKIPVNTHGGNLAQGFIHGIGTLVEGVRQLRGESPNPVAGARNCLVISGSPAPIVSSVIFSNEG